jgi:type IV pilus assembly protein PilO
MSATIDRTTLEVVARRASARKIAERARTAVTMLNLHFAGVAVLGLVNLYLIVHMLLSYQQMHSQNDDAVAAQKVTLTAAKLGAMPLEGLDAKLDEATSESDAFYQKRLPSAYSQMLAEVGALATKDRVKLSRVQYGQAPVLEGSTGELTQVQMDANLSGDYRPLVLFMNSLERDKMFFLIDAIALSGQQSGTVNLRLRLTTYLRARGPGEALEMVKPPVKTAHAAAARGAR